MSLLTWTIALTLIQRYIVILDQGHSVCTEDINIKLKFVNRSYPVQLVNNEVNKCLLMHRTDTASCKTPEDRNY